MPTLVGTLLELLIVNSHYGKVKDMRKLIELNDDQWDAQFHTGDAIDEFDQLPEGLDIHHIWTGIEGDSGDYLIVNGCATVNRINYYVSVMPWIEGNDYLITVKF